MGLSGRRLSTFLEDESATWFFIKTGVATTLNYKEDCVRLFFYV